MRDNFFSNTTINSIIKRHLEKELSSFTKIKYVLGVNNAKHVIRPGVEMILIRPVFPDKEGNN